MATPSGHFDLDRALGRPLGPYLRDGEVLRCDYSGGASIVNPTDHKVYVDLHATYQMVTGETVNHVVLLPHSHVYVLKVKGP